MEVGTFLKLLFLAIIILIYIYLAVRFGSWGWFVSKKQYNDIEKQYNDSGKENEGKGIISRAEIELKKMKEENDNGEK